MVKTQKSFSDVMTAGMTVVGPKQVLNLNLNSLLVKRQIDNPSPGVVTGGN